MFSCFQFQVTKYKMPCINNMLPILRTKKVPQKDNMFNSIGSMRVVLFCKDRDIILCYHIFLVKSYGISFFYFILKRMVTYEKL